MEGVRCRFWQAGGEPEGALFHLGGHERKRIGAGGGEVFAETGLLDERHVRLKNGIRRLAIENPDENRDHAW